MPDEFLDDYGGGIMVDVVMGTWRCRPGGRERGMLRVVGLAAGIIGATASIDRRSLL